MRKDRTMENRPMTVPRKAKQIGEAQAATDDARVRAQDAPLRARWVWVQPSIWTTRMLKALENGVKGNVWFSLIDKVHSASNLSAAWAQVRANDGAAGVDHVTVEMFAKRAEAKLSELSEELRTGRYRPRAIRRVYIPKPDGTRRPLGIPAVRDRVVQTALRDVIEPIFEREFARHSYGFRPGRGCKDALRRVDELLKQGYRYVVDADLKSYFDTIPHDRLMERVRERVADGRVLKLIESYLSQQVMEGLEQWTPAAGSPQGAVVSPLLSNIYLNPLDHLMAGKGYEMVRYADDFVILCRSEPEACLALEEVRRWTAEAALSLHPDKTRIADAESEDGFEFLGYRFSRGQRRPRKKSLAKLKDAIRLRTRRTSGVSLGRIIANVNPVLRGWFEYFKHSHRWTFEPIDRWIRMRLRSILRKRRKMRGRGRGSDHQRWPNKFFAGAGLYSLSGAYLRSRQSARAVPH
jgi:RNA-directed DNA polymerase